jgi:hypothetical protein
MVLLLISRSPRLADKISPRLGGGIFLYLIVRLSKYYLGIKKEGARRPPLSFIITMLPSLGYNL